MLLNSFYQMTQVIVYVFINEAEQHAVWQDTGTMYHCISLCITIYHYINSILMCGFIHIIYT